MTEGGYKGIPAGKYSVTIEKFEIEKQDDTPPPPPVATQSAQGNGPGPGPPPPPPAMPPRGTVIPRYQLVEDVYLDHAKTPLKDIEVRAGTNEIPLSAGKEQRISKPLRPGM